MVAKNSAARCCGDWPACWQLGRDYVGPEMDDWVLWVRKPSDRCRLSPLSEPWWLDDVTALVLLNVAQHCTLVVLLCWALGSQSPSRVVPLVLGRGPAFPVFMAAVPWTVRPGRGTPVGKGWFQEAYWARVHNVTWTPFEKDKYQRIFLSYKQKRNGPKCHQISLVKT